MTNANVLPISRGEVVRQKELEAFLESLEAEIDAVALQVGEPEQTADGTELEALVVKQATQKVRIRSNNDFYRVWDETRDMQTLKGRIEGTYKSVKKAADTLHKKIKANEDYYLKRVIAARDARKVALSDHYEKMERKWEARQAELEAIAAGQVAEGEAAQAVVAPPTIEKPEGGSIGKKYEGRLDSLLDLVKAAAENPDLLKYLAVNESAINKQASIDKETLHIPGVSPVWKPSVRVNAWK